MAVAGHLEQPTRGWCCTVWVTPRRLFGLAPTGGCRAVDVTADAVGSYPTVSPLPAGCPTGGLFSVALSVAFRRPGVTWQSTRWSSDFPRDARRRSRPSRSASAEEYNGREGEGANGRAVGMDGQLRSGKVAHRPGEYAAGRDEARDTSPSRSLVRPLALPGLPQPRQPLLRLAHERLQRSVGRAPLTQHLLILLPRLRSAAQLLERRGAQ